MAVPFSYLRGVLDRGGSGHDEAKAVAQLKATLRSIPPFNT
jgi:hypothetical protein